MTGEIVKAQSHNHTAPGGALSLSAMTPHDAWLFCQSMAGANLLPPEYRNNPASVLWAMEYGRALGLDVVTTITTIHVIKGKPTQSADLMLSRAREAGHRVRIKSEREQCVVSIVRHDDQDDHNTIEWTLADARQAQLYPGKPDSNWAKYPRAMLRARAIAECVRLACPEVLHGAIYTPEELGAVVDQEGNVVRVDPDVRVERVDATPAPAAEPQPGGASTAPDFIADAQKAATADAVLAVWQQAKAAGASEVYLNRIVAVGREKRTAEQGGAPDEPVDVEVVDDHAAAVTELREAATAVGMAAQVDADFESSYGTPVAEATVDNLRAMAGLLRGAA